MKIVKGLCIYITASVLFTPLVEHYVVWGTGWVMVAGFIVYRLAGLFDDMTN